MSISATRNEYSALVSDVQASKAVWMALAVSFAVCAAGDDELIAERLTDTMLAEWAMLHTNGIVPQRPRRATRRTP